MVINDTFLKAISWTLIHSLWQGFLLAFLAGIAILFTRKSAAVIRYNVLAGLFVTFIVAAGFTFNYEFQQEQAETITRFNLPVANQSLTQVIGIESGVSVSEIAITFLNQNANLIAMIWFVIFAIKIFGICSGFSQIYRIRNYKTESPSQYWIEKLAALGERINLKKRTILLESRLVKTPSVTGFFKPIILVPVGLLSQLPHDQIEAILLHELAHIRRKDYFINILQSLAEVVFFFNPGVLWLSSLLKDERENCCDDIAISVTENKAKFVHALVSFEEYNLKNSQLAMGFGGNKNHLLNRARRIIHNNNKSLNAVEKTFLSVSLLFVAVLMIACSNAKFSDIGKTKITQADIRKADKEALKAEIKAKQDEVAYKEIASRSEAKARQTEMQADQATAEANKATAIANQADLIARQADVEAAKAKAITDAAVKNTKSESKTVRTVTSKTKTSHTQEIETAISTTQNHKISGKTVSVRTGVTGEDLPDDINTDKLTQDIISDLMSEKIISTTKNLSYKLSNKSLIVNGVVQPESKYSRVRAKYIKTNMYAICYNYEISDIRNMTE